MFSLTDPVPSGVARLGRLGAFNSSRGDVGPGVGSEAGVGTGVADSYKTESESAKLQRNDDDYNTHGSGMHMF